MKWRDIAAIIGFSAVMYWVVLLLTGCTIAPKPVAAEAVSFSGNAQNGGLVGRLADGGYEITVAAAGRYDSLIDEGYGKTFTPALKKGDGLASLPNGDIEIDDEHLVDFGAMATAKRSGQKP